MLRQLAVVLLLAGCASSLDLKHAETFDERERLPSDWSQVVGAWTVVADDSAPSPPNALAQTRRTSTHALLMSPYATPEQGEVRLKVLISGGRAEREAGMVVRYQSPIDHYIFNIDANEGGVRFTRVVGGLRDDLHADRNVLYSLDQWHELQLRVDGSTFTGFVNGKKAFQVSDETHQDGAIGVWTRADTEARLDDLEIRA